MNVQALEELIAHLETQPSSVFNMHSAAFTDCECGTAACIAGHLYALHPKIRSTYSFLGISSGAADQLFTPIGWYEEREKAVLRYPLSRAIATLKRLRDHYLATGQVVVDWGPEPGAEPLKPWSAPIVSGGLPASLTDALKGLDCPLTVEVGHAH